MRPNGTLVGTRWGPISAIRPQPRTQHAAEVRAGVPIPPWGSRKLPSKVLADDPRRTLFRSLLRRAEGVRVEFADGGTGVVGDVVFGMLGFDFWPKELLVRIPDRKWRGPRDRVRRVPVSAIRQIDVREPRIWVGSIPAEPLAHDDERPKARPHAERRAVSRLAHDLAVARTRARRSRPRREVPAGTCR